MYRKWTTRTFNIGNKQFSQFTKYKRLYSLLNLVLKNEFDKKIQKIDANSSEKDIIQKDIINNVDAKKQMIYDLAKIGPAQKAVEKMSNNETPLKKEFSAYSDLKNQYEEILAEDSDSENESTSNEFSSPKQNQNGKLNDLKFYLKSEYKSTVNSLNRLKKLLSKQSDKISLEKETTKRRIEEYEDKDSSKKSRQSVHDFVENLPTDYNPLDDNVDN